jgi:hypothetical protein
MSPPRTLLALSLAVAVVVPVAGAGAQSGKPVPCTGVLIKDAKGDQTKAPVGGGSAGLPYGSGGPENIDIRGLFFNFQDGVLTANIQINNLTSEVPAEAREGEVRYLVDFATQGDGVTNLYAKLNADGWSFVWTKELVALPEPVGPVNFGETETKGKVFEGPDGVIQIEFPPEAGIKAGAELAEVITRVSLGDNTVVFVSDQAPDGGYADAVKFKVAACPAGGAATPNAAGGAGGSGTGAPAGGGPGTATPGPQPTPGQPGAGLLPVAGPLSVSFAVDKGKRKTARTRGLRGRIRCTVQCKVTAVASIDKKVARKLKLGKKAMKVGTGKATIVKAGRVPFFIKLNKKAKKALGRKGVKKFGLKVAFKVTDLNGKQMKKSTKKSTLR